MTTVTLDDVRAAHTQLGALLAQLAPVQASAPAAPTFIMVDAADIELAPGEHYAGLIAADDGTPDYHLVLLPGDAEDLTWDAAREWAARAGGDLPDRREQALLFANAKGQFKPTWYWSNTPHETDGSYAWFQYFYDGDQDDGHKGYEGRARAVRRFAA